MDFNVRDKERSGTLKNVWRWRIGGIPLWRLLPGASWTCRIIKSFEQFKNFRNDSKARTLGVVWVEVERRWTTFCHVWIAASKTEKKRVLHRIVTGDEKQIHYDNPKRKTEYPWFEASALHLVGSAGCSLSWAAQTIKTIQGDRYRLQWMRLTEHWRKNGRFASRVTRGHMLQNEWKPIWKRLNGKLYPNSCIHQTLPRQIITCSDRWHIVWLCSSFILMKMPKMSLLVVSLKRRIFFFSDVKFKCCQKDGENQWLAMDNSLSDMFLNNFWK